MKRTWTNQTGVFSSSLWGVGSLRLYESCDVARAVVRKMGLCYIGAKFARESEVLALRYHFIGRVPGRRRCKQR